MTDQKYAHILHLSMATRDSTDQLKGIWSATQPLMFDTSGTGTQADAYQLEHGSVDINIRTPKGSAGSFSGSILAETNDDAAGLQMKMALENHSPVVATYRQFREENGKWMGREILTACGFVIGFHTVPGSSGFITLEVHYGLANGVYDSTGGRDRSFDCLNEEYGEGGSSKRQAQHLEPPEGPNDNWELVAG